MTRPWNGKSDRRIRRSEHYEVVLFGGKSPVLFIGRRRGGGLLAMLGWPALVEIADLVDQVVLPPSRLGARKGRHR